MRTLPFAHARKRQEPEPSDGLAEFASESDPAPVVSRAPAFRVPRWVMFVVAALIAAGGSAWAYTAYRGSVPATGSLRVESDPPGVDVRIDGTVRGRTPLAISLPAGRHELQLERDGQTQQIAMNVVARAETIHHISWAAPAPAIASAISDLGALQVVTDPPGAAVDVDGVNRGTSPLSLTDLTAGEHQVVVRGAKGGTTQRRTVRVEAGSSASLVIGTAAPAPASGWMQITAAIPLQIFENGTLIGTTEAARVMLPAGQHDLELTAPTLGFRTKRTVDIGGGRTTTVAVTLDRAPLSVNASPWAEVWIDGARAGETPMAAVMTTIGPHMVEFRHPELGRKSVPVQVSLSEPNRISVDMRTR